MVLQLHFLLTMVLAMIGLSSLTAATLGQPVESRAFFITLTSGAIVISLLIHKSLFDVSKGDAGHNVLKRDAGIYIGCAAIAIILGLTFFTSDLVPSGMTGDPYRHIIRTEEIFSAPAAPHRKPIYYLVLGAFGIHLPSSFRDKLFLIGNIAFLWYCTASATLLFSRAFPSANPIMLMLTGTLIGASYPFFSLQYGYYPLILAAGIYFSAILLYSESTETTPDNHRFLVSAFLMTGVTLTHPFLSPAALLTLLAFHASIAIRTRTWIGSKHWPIYVGWTIMLAVFILSLNLDKNTEIEGHVRTLQLRGLVNESPLLNLEPFLPAVTTAYFVQADRQRAKVIWLALAATAAYSMLMWCLMLMGKVAPYYVNRNQILLLPLSIILACGLLTRFWGKFKKSCLFASIMVFAYMAYIAGKTPKIPLSRSDSSFVHLLRSDSFVFEENFRNAAHAPLQFTENDRSFLRSLKQAPGKCFGDQIPDRMAVLGTDHAVMWFHEYTGIYPSLFDRNDQFIHLNGYLQNFQLWKSDKSQIFIAVTSHFDFWNQRKIINEIDNMATTVCRGDSFMIYRKSQ